MDPRALECLQPRRLADIQYGFTVLGPSSSSSSYRQHLELTWTTPAPAPLIWFPPLPWQISITGLAKANCRESGLPRVGFPDCQCWTGSGTAILLVSIIKDAWLTGLHEPQGRRQSARPISCRLVLRMVTIKTKYNFEKCTIIIDSFNHYFILYRPFFNRNL